MKKYRKRPVVVEAARWDGMTLDGKTLRESLEGEWFRDGEIVTIKTLEGNMKANPGDWIIKGINGKFYPCKNDIFEKTYEINHDSKDDSMEISETVNGTVIRVGTNDIWIEWKEDDCGFLIGDGSNCCSFFMDDLRDIQDALEKFDGAQAAYLRAKNEKE